MSVWRPCDVTETVAAWRAALSRNDGPTSLALTRQGLVPQERSAEQVTNIAKGGYVLSDCDGEPEAILIATGSEVQVAMEAKVKLSEAGKNVRVVSMPSTDVFEKQDAAYRESVLPSHILARVAVEAAHVDYWYKYVGLDGRIVGMTSFGESAPAGQLFEYFDITADAVVAAVEDCLPE